MQTYIIALLAGDGIGPEIMSEAVKILNLVESRNDVQFDLQPASFGASAYFETGKSFPDNTVAVCDNADAILKGPIGLSHEESKMIPVDDQPERGGLLPMRKRYDTYANFRPVYLPRSLSHFSPLRPEIIGEGIDFIIIRELVGGLYFGNKDRGINNAGRRYVHEMLEYDEDQIRRVLKVAFQLARKRKNLLHNVHKSNVLMSSVLWNEVLDEVRADYPEVEVEHILVDAAATYPCLEPTRFDVVVTENMFGDILSDQGGGILGSLGLMPSACVGPDKSYSAPSHGSAPDIFGKKIANPIGMIWAGAMMLQHFGYPEAHDTIIGAIETVLANGMQLTPDMGGKSNTAELGKAIADAV